MTTDPFTEAARAEAERQYSPEARLPAMKPTDRMDELPRLCAIDGFMAGAEWARTHPAAEEPTDAEVEAAANAILAHEGETEESAHSDLYDAAWDHARAALSAARAARPALEQRIRELHAADADGNCSHCTRGRVYPVPAPCETVRALAGGGEGR